ncbi:PadR family transcriptional regulator [Fictibacillus gelatini]|uniref:PadR family transcriptional regulator n=1 Tax=Fictibacillus gelatini TaxID=225985 RepID=UPI0003F4DA56|nr:PadR family transcriptional regulator [Fictibacillus gelatini]
MEDRLKNLKNLRKRNVFNELQFTEEHRQNIYRTIQKEKENDHDVVMAVLQLLANPKTGFEIIKNLRSRGIKRFENDEGSIYTLLHHLVQKEYIITYWDENNIKQYALSYKGKKVLKKAERQQKALSSCLKDLLEGDLLYE